MAREIVELEVAVRQQELEAMEFYPEAFAEQIAASREWLALLANPEYFEAKVLLEVAKAEAWERARASQHVPVYRPEELIA